MEHTVISKTDYSRNCFELNITREGLYFDPGTCISIYDRPYSICSSPSDDYITLLIRRFPGGKISGRLAQLLPGDKLDIGEVFNYFSPGSTDKRYCFIATGVGISPFISALKANKDKHKPELILYGARFKNELYNYQWLKNNFNIKFAVTKDNVEGLDIHQGRVTEILDQLPIEDDIIYYLCGIEGMITDVSEYLMNYGVGHDRIKQELFYSDRNG